MESFILKIEPPIIIAGTGLGVQPLQQKRFGNLTIQKSFNTLLKSGKTAAVHRWPGPHSD